MLDYHEMMIIANQIVFKKLTRNRIVKYIDNFFIYEDKSIEIFFKEDINSI